ncbi:unnamed protein product [Larinioides sclopetarius]|uniref:Uncharacterized protein n=1 Tax=Larinioides sclopetarius TaxID=280406 RepID=A0AAV2BF29_9ARAC
MGMTTTFASSRLYPVFSRTLSCIIYRISRQTTVQSMPFPFNYKLDIWLKEEPSGFKGRIVSRL